MGGCFLILFIIILVVVVAAITLAVKLPEAKRIRAKRLEAERNGMLIKRRASFYEDKEFFKSYIQDPNSFFNALTANVQATGVCSFSGNYNSRIVYNGLKVRWTVVLERLQSNDGSMIFSLGLTHYEQTQLSSVADVSALHLDLNYLYTAIERTFLQFDPNTQLTLQAINFKNNSKYY